MKVNQLLNEIIRGTWLLDAQYVMTAGEMVSRILSNDFKALNQKHFDLNGAPVEAGVFDVYNPDGQKLERGMRGDVPSGSTAFIMMNGPIIKYGDYCTWGADELVSFLQRADNNPNIDKIILYIDTPGGSVNAIAPFKAFGAQRKTDMDVVVDQCCSLGMWAACSMGPDVKIYADNTISSIIGSVGVQLSFMDAIPHYEAQGYKWHRITPPESSEKNKIFEEVLAGNYDRINREQMSPIAIKFQNDVKAARPNLKLTAVGDNDDVEGVLKGATFNYENALRVGLIDGVSSVDQILMNKKLRTGLEESRRESAIQTI